MTNITQFERDKEEAEVESEAEVTRRREVLVRESIAFMQAIIREYGESKGEEMWETIVNTLDPSIKRQILMMMLTGHYSTKIMLRGFRGEPRKVHAIKAVRAVTGLGLKEAKEIIDKVYGDYSRGKAYHPYEVVTKGVPVELEVEPAARQDVIKELEAAGVLI